MSDLRRRLAGALSASGYSVKPDENRLTPLAEKLDFLLKTNRYSRLISGLLDANNGANLRSLVLEVTFAFQFETGGMLLQYEVSHRPDDETSVDFLLQAESGKQLCIEMRLVQQRQKLTTLFEQQLRESDYFGTILDGADDRAEILRVQGLILEKAVNPCGKRIKFESGGANNYNIVAIEVSELLLGMIDHADCCLAAYGDPAVPQLARRQMFGLFQEPRPEYPQYIQEVAARFAPFRWAVHAILFLKKIPPGSHIDYRLEYLLIRNRQLMSSEEAKKIAYIFNGAMDTW